MNPLKEYGSRRDRWRAQRESLELLFVRIGNWRLILGLLEAALAWFVFARRSLSGWFLLLPLFAFLVLVVWHSRIVCRRTGADRALKFYEGRLARLSSAWIGSGPSGDPFRSPDHVYSEDLDLFGKGSLFELISTCRLAAGERTLASWLLAPAAPDAVMARQAAVRELSTCLDLREEIALLGEDIRADVHAERLETWGSQSAIHFPAGTRIVAPILAVTGTFALIAAFAAWWPLWPSIVILACDLLLRFACRQQVAQVTATIETPAEGLRLLAQVLARLETEQFASPYLQHLRGSLEVSGLPASKRIRRLEYWLDWLDSSDHLLVRIIAPLLLWREQLAMIIEAWRCENGPQIGAWVRAVAEFEALSSLAALTFERPAWSFPLIATDGAPQFEAEALQHPLLAPAECVPNDLSLNDQVRLLIVSGSNMSGKSTLLRAVGLNTVLAWAGGPVAARLLRTSPVRLGSSIRVSDSLQDNRSRFMAEILRLRQIIELLRNDQPVLFLMDELLSGTNSHDRTIGASGLIHELLRSGAIGLISTHDLALTQIASETNLLAANVHFEDSFVNGEIRFDYVLKEGIVRRSNGIELMRAIGLPV